MTTLEKILQEIEKIKNEHPYKVQGKYETYSQYNEAWQDCAYRIESVIEAMITKNDGWIPVEDGMPEERNSMFAKWKGTDKWSAAMFEKISDDVNVTVEYEDGTRRTITAHTLDGKWALPNRVIEQKVIAWRPMPEPCRKEGE